MRHAAYVGLGSNLDDPVEQVRTAIAELDTLALTRLAGHSSLYRSAPVGPPGQPAYVNSVARLETGLAPEALLEELQRLERAHGRVRAERWGPRTLDLDLLLYGRSCIDTPTLKVPHPELAHRPFVLVPLAEIDAALEVPGLGPLAVLLERCGRDGLERLAP
jgi:2-amino-4-hydroxy-6-hydroxymethyldihydropteridine diphosphokinase